MSRNAATQDPQGVRPPEEVDPQRVRQILAKHARGRGQLIAALQDLQAVYGYLPEDALRMVADETGRSLVDVYGIATFYRGFALEPRGRHLVFACLGTACHVRGARRVVDELERQLGIRAGETTADKEFTLETVNCLGACALGPIVVVDGHYFSNVRASRVGEILEKARTGLDADRLEGEEGALGIEVNCPRCNHSLMDPEQLVDDAPSIRLTIALEGGRFQVNLSSLLGRHAVACEASVPVGEIVRFVCPHCREELLCRSRCGECGAPMAPLAFPAGGILQLCCRGGCGGHRLDPDGADA